MAVYYKTTSGQTWDAIAKEVYGDESYTSFLMSNNQDLIDVFIFSAGELLLIEDAPETESSSFPTWRY